jgi:rhodanese-related sulfurtransferase
VKKFGNTKGKTEMLNRKIILLAAGFVVVAAIAFSLLNTNTTCCADAPTDAVQSISPAGYQDQFTSTTTLHLLIDVRTPEEFASGHIDGAVNIPVDSLQNRLNEVPDDQPIVVYCRSGNRSATASQILAQAGYTHIYDLGGLNAWTAQGFPVE